MTMIIQLMPAVPVAVLPIIPAIIITIASSTSGYGPKYPFAPGIKAVPGSVKAAKTDFFRRFLLSLVLRGCVPAFRCTLLGLMSVLSLSAAISDSRLAAGFLRLSISIGRSDYRRLRS